MQVNVCNWIYTNEFEFMHVSKWIWIHFDTCKWIGTKEKASKRSSCIEWLMPSFRWSPVGKNIINENNFNINPLLLLWSANGRHAAFNRQVTPCICSGSHNFHWYIQLKRLIRNTKLITSFLINSIGLSWGE